MGPDGEAEGFVGGLLGVRQRHVDVPVHGKLVAGHRVVHLAADVLLLQGRLDRVAPPALNAHGVLVDDVSLGQLGHGHARDIGEQLVVARGDGPAPAVVLVDVGQLHSQDGGLQRVEPRVVAQHLVVVLV